MANRLDNPTATEEDAPESLPSVSIREAIRATKKIKAVNPKKKPSASPTNKSGRRCRATIRLVKQDRFEREPSEFRDMVEQLEKHLDMPVWLLVQNGKGPFCNIDALTAKGFQNRKRDIQENKPVALLIESAGGLPNCAYYIARYFQRRASTFLTIVPQYAKSAATLIAVAGNEILMGRDAELGPLDVQVFDAAKERFSSALNTLQSLERLHADTMTMFDEMMQLLLMRTGKRLDLLLPEVLKHATDFVRPLVEKIDTFDYTEKSRVIKMAEEYASRVLINAGYDGAIAATIASKFVTNYSDHGFIIDRDEAQCLDAGSGDSQRKGLKIREIDDKVEKIFDDMIPFLDGLTVIGRFTEI